MQIDGTGFTKATLIEYLDALTADIRAEGTFGSDFTIKKEGVIDNIFATICNAFIALEDKVAYALKNKNPYVAEGQWQDDLYSLVGLKRDYATHTVVTRTIEGTANLTIQPNELVFKTSQNDEFYLNTTITLDNTGKGVGSFTAYESGAVECPTDSNLTIVSAPTGVLSVYYISGNLTSIGDDYEDDTEYRMKWLATNSISPNAKTSGGMRSALLPLCNNNPNNIDIRQNRNSVVYSDFDKHTMEIVIKSSESDNTIAQTILNNLTDGVGLYGTTTVTIKDDENQDVDIKFTKPTSVAIYFNIEVVLKDNYSLANVSNEIKKAIVNNFNYNMGERVVANDFYQYINVVEGVDYVSTLEVGLSSSSYSPTITIDYDEYSTVETSDITVTEDI